MSPKQDADRIAATIDKLVADPRRARTRRSSWPRYVYRYTDLHNAVSILQHSCIYCRREAERRGLIVLDSASPAIIAQSPWAHGYVRLYFRPLTPTQYHTEGIRPPQCRNYGDDAHCPVPVMFLFDSKSVLSMAGCKFSRGNLARTQHLVGDDADFFEQLPFDDIYHDGALPQQRREEVHNAKQAEVLVPRVLELQNLVAVVCRTGAERDTLLALLAREGGDPGWANVIRIQRPDEQLFEEDWAYVEDVRLIGDQLHIVAHLPSYRSRGRELLYRDHLYVTDHDTGEEWDEEDPGFRLDPAFYYELPWHPERVMVRYELEGCLAYEAFVSQVAIL